MKDQPIFDFYITPDGEEFNLRDYETIFILAEGGLGMPDLDIKTQRAPFQHGVNWIDYYLTPRPVTMILRRNASSYSDYWEKRAELINIFRPNRQDESDRLKTGKLRRIFPNGDIRDLNVILSQGIKYQRDFTQGWDEFTINEPLQFVAFDPTYYDPTVNTLSPSVSSLDNLVFPFTFDPAGGLGLIFGSSVIYDTFNVTYMGTWLSIPDIMVTGSLSAFKVENLSTGKIIGLNYTIPLGRTVTFNCIDGTVEDDLGTNLIGYLTDESDLSSFYIAVEPEVAGGVNQIRFSGSGAKAGATDIVLSYYTRYIGL